jgi:hypothetical protein
MSSRIPSGQLVDGTVYYTEDDLRTKDGVSIALLPIGDAALHVLPSGGSEGRNFVGDPTPITCFLNNGIKTYRCCHIVKKADAKKGTKQVVC